MKKLYKRFKEPSTWAGVAGLLLSVSPFLPPPWHVCVQGTAAVAAWLSVQMKEKGPTP